MKTFLINYELAVYQYMEHGKKIKKLSILVEAEDEDKAKKTLEKYWENKSDSYGTSYGIMDMEVVPSIKQTDILK